MFSVKFIPNVFAFYDRTGIQAFLEKQASRGWHLENTGILFWKFRRTEAKTVHYSVTYQGKLEPDDPAADARNQLFAEYCAHGGWELAADNARMQIFRSEAEDPTPIETDAMMEVENIHRAAKKSVLAARIMNVITAVLLITAFVMRLWNMPLTLLLSASSVIYFVCLLLLFFVPLAEMVMYICWYRKARRAAGMDGSFVPTDGTRIHAVLRILLGILVLLLLLSFGAQLSLAMVIGGIILLAGAVLIIQNSKRMRENCYPAFENRTYTALLMVVLILVSVVATNILMNIQGHCSATPYDAPLHSYHMNSGAAVHDNCNSRVEDSLFVRQAIVACSADEERLVYNVADVKLGAAYGIALDNYLLMYEDPMYKKLLGEGFDPTFRETDATVWGANAAYYLYNEKLGGNIYILCYDSRILYISYTQDLTPDRIETVKQLLELDQR